ncbi:hypothetical protein RBU55_18935 [Pseudomonas chlororaphis subsp. aurantiaca]|uniref:hypothetical protein n=1 Tax=Pseudomonas chlororaphis TaxID=587753 RepID=UPI0027DB6162|nr:hypothetical protein [Pseudomonas chlororaphis]WMI97634.1 hypothetical protein RBU55_18935 [Pseudomonas chlororaphis subsp. aurantiaca]
MSSFKESMALHDQRFLDVVYEPWWSGPIMVLMTLFPSVIIQQQVNSVSTRQILTNGVGSFDFVWTHFGFEDDSAEMTERRLRQDKLFGPAGFVSADDGEVIEFSQEGFDQKKSHRTLAELGGRTCPFSLRTMGGANKARQGFRLLRQRGAYRGAAFDDARTV